jgi:sugar lactone lactonase YvrE
MKDAVITADLFAVAGANHAEGPFWDDAGGRLLFVDALAGSIVSVDARGGIARFPLPSPVVTVIRRRTLGGFVVATEHELVVTDENFSAYRQLAQVISDPALRTNDGGCDPLGGFVIGTMAYDLRQGAGAVFRVNSEQHVTEILSGVTISNGVQWSADGSHVYYIDSPTRRVDTFQVDSETGRWSGRTEHIAIDDPNAVPDGMAIDLAGGLWVALWGAGEVNHYDCTGRLVKKIAVPGVTQVSSCAFGGADRSTLFITTSRQNLPPDAEPLAGAVFAVETDSRGAPLSEFAEKP